MSSHPRCAPLLDPPCVQVGEHTAQLYLENDKPNVSGIVLAGSAAFKVELNQSQHFDQRLKKIVIKTVDVSYGGLNGFNQAIELAAEALSNVKFIAEKKLISNYFDQVPISRPSPPCLPLAPLLWARSFSGDPSITGGAVPVAADADTDAHLVRLLCNADRAGHGQHARRPPADLYFGKG